MEMNRNSILEGTHLVGARRERHYRFAHVPAGRKAWDSMESH